MPLEKIAVFAPALDGGRVIALERGDLPEKLRLVVSGERLRACAAFSRRLPRLLEAAEHRQQEGAVQERTRMRRSRKRLVE